MKVLSLFSGVGGFDLGLEAAGMETVFQCEWDKHATRILERHWPDVPRWTDVSTLTGAYVLQHAPVIDVVAWGSPCQDLSVAGKRAGLSGERSGLFHQGIRIIKEIRELTNGKYPRISVWENVAGALSSGAGADFGQVLYEMDEAGACFSEWRMLDAQYFGVPQRRRRVFVVSVFDPRIAANCPDPLLPVSEGVRWNPATSRTTRQTTTRPAEESVGSSGEVAGSLTWRMKNGYNGQDAYSNLLQVVEENHARPIGEPFTGTSHAQYGAGVGTLRANGGDLAGGSETLLVEPFVKAKRAQSTTDDETWVEGDINPTINQFDQGDVRATTAIVIQDGREIDKNQNGLGIAESGAPAYTLDQTGAQSVAIGIQGNVIGRQDHNGPAGKGHTDEGDPMFTLNTTDHHAVATSIGFSHTQGLSAQPSEEAFPTLRREGSGMAVAFDEYNDTLGGDVHHALRAGTKQSTGVVEPTMTVRRLTPLECERLMGWPDDWTAGQADTHRYKQCGNGVASPVAQWIGEQIINL